MRAEISVAGVRVEYVFDLGALTPDPSPAFGRGESFVISVRIGSSFDFAQDEPFWIWDEVLSLRAVDGWAAGLNPAS